MNFKNTLLLSFLFAGLLISCSDDESLDTPETGQMEQEEQQEDIADEQEDTDEPLAALTLTNVSYGDNDQQIYDIYLPEGRTTATTKVLLLVHGGGWTGGDKADMAPFISFIQENHPDHAIVNLNYVLAALPNTPAFPNQYLDIQAVIDQLIAQKEELAILPEFGMIGTSAGAHLSMVYDYTYDTEDRVKFVVNIVGPSDFSDPFYADDPQFELALSLLVDESAYPAGTDYVAVNSPALIVNDASSPTLLFYGDQDPLVPLTNGIRLDAALTNENIEHVYTVYAGGHGDDWSDESVADLSIKTSTYINTFLAID